MAHEIGNQLALLGYAELVAERYADDPEARELTDPLLAARRRLSSMVASIREFVRGAGGANIREHAAAGPARRRGAVDPALRAGVKLRKYRSNDDAARAVVNKAKLVQVVINLVRTRSRRPARVAGSRRSSRRGGSAVIEVIDDGTGIGPITWSGLGSRSSRPRGAAPGSGWGSARGSSRSTAGGSDNRVVTGCRHRGRRHAAANHGHRDGIISRLLVVDDEPGFAKLVQALLGGEHVIDEVSSAEAALASMDEVAYDVVLTNLHMPPGPTGIELMKRARERDVDIPFIVLTGHATVESAVDAMREGARVDYLRKAASGDELRTSVQRALGHGRMLREVRRLRQRGRPERGPVSAIGPSATRRGFAR